MNPLRRSFLIFCRLLLFCCLFSIPLSAQNVPQTSIQRSTDTQTLNGRLYYIHIVQPGQTVYSIARAYGAKEFDAVVKKDVHFISSGDTVWIPVAKASAVNGQTSQPAAKSSAASSRAEAPTTVPAPIIRNRIDPKSVTVSLLIPLKLNKMNEISATKFDIEQRGRKTYESFDFIQFYEGVMMALEELRDNGCNVILNVVDVPDNTTECVEAVWSSHNVQKSDFVIAMLLKVAFDKAAQLAQRDHIFIVNPNTTREDILNGNPYVFKCQPSDASKIASILTSVRSNYGVPHVFLLYSDTPNNQELLTVAKQQLDNNALPYTLVNWASNSKLPAALKGHNNALFLSVYDHSKDRNRIFATSLLNKLGPLTAHCQIVLATLDNWCDTYKDIDIPRLQNLSYHTFLNTWDYDSKPHLDFLTAFRDRFKTEPVNFFAAQGHDLMLYFVTGFSSRGKDFWSNPNIPMPNGMLRPLHFVHPHPGWGFDCTEAPLYRMTNYQFIRL